MSFDVITMGRLGVDVYPLQSYLNTHESGDPMSTTALRSIRLALCSFGDWKDSPFGDHHIHGHDPAHHRGHVHFPTGA